MEEVNITQSLLQIADAIDSLGLAIVVAAFVRGFMNK